MTSQSGKRHIMIDLETMGVRPSSAVVSIGCVEFMQTDVISVFYTPVSLESCLKAGLTTDKSTVKWWQTQSDEARRAWDTSTTPLQSALTLLDEWLLDGGPTESVCVWGNGADFDPVLLSSAYRAIGRPPLHKFYNVHCFRTLKNLFPVEKPARDGTHHNALDDAIHQVKHLHKILQEHGITLPR